MMSETPRTDAELRAEKLAYTVVPVDFARQLERENAALRTVLTKIRDATHTSAVVLRGMASYALEK